MMQVTSCMEDQDGGNVVKRLSVPVGLEELMTGLTKEVLQKKPKDIYNFASDHFAQLLALRDNGNYQQAPTKSITYASKGNVEKHLLNGKTPSTKSSDGTPTKLSRQVSIRAASPTRKNGTKIKRSGTPKHENNNNKEAKLKDKQDNKKPVSSRRQTPGCKSKFDNLEPVQEDALKMLTKRQSLSRRSTDRKNKTDSENNRDSKRSSSEESEKRKRPSRDTSLKKKTAEKKMQGGDSKEAKDKKNGQEKLKRKKEESVKNSIEEASDTRNTNETGKAQAVSTFGLQHSSEIYDAIIPTETPEESFKDQSKSPIKALGLQHSGEIHDTVIPTKTSEQSSKDQSKSPVEVRDLQNRGETHDTVIPTEISDDSFKDQPTPLVKGLGLQHSGETHDTAIPTAISEENSKHQSNPPVEVLGLQHSGEVHDTVIPTEESFKHHSKDKNENVNDDLQEKFILKSPSIEESTTGIKDGRLTVTPPKILKGFQTTSDDFYVPTTLVVPVLATTGEKSPAESISAAEQTDENKIEALHEDSETGETVTSSKDEDDFKDLSLTKYDSSVLRKELQQVEEEIKLNNFTSSYNPYKLKQEIRNASKELEGEQGVGSTHLSTELERLDKKSEHLKEDEKVIKDRTEDTEQDVSKVEYPYAKKISHEEAKEKTIDVTLQQPKVSGHIENNKLHLLHAQTAVSEGSTTGSVEGTSLDNKEMPEEEVIEDNELQKSLTAPDTTDTKTPVRLGSTSKLQHSGELHDQVIPNQPEENKNAITAVDESLTTPEKTPTTLESISGLQHSSELHDQVIPKESDENKSVKAADVEPAATSGKTPTALESISGLQHSGELHDQLIPKESDENRSAKAADVKSVVTSEKTPTALESISGLQHSGELHDQVIPKESDENKNAKATDVEPVATSGKSPTALESISGLQHSGELHDQVIPKESGENKSAKAADVERVASLEKTPTVLESISGFQHGGELHDQVISKESDENRSATAADVEAIAKLRKCPTALESISGLQHSGESHDQVIPNESVENKSATTEVDELLETVEKTPTVLESISGLQHCGELHDDVIPKESDKNKSAKAEDVKSVVTPEKTPTALESISGLQHSGELHDEVIPKESDENRSTRAADVKPVATPEKIPTALESISGIQHSGELHDQVIPKESDENKGATAAEVEPVGASEKTPTVLESISGLQHSGELHDQVIPKESDENKGATAAEVEPVGASEKTPTALELISGLQHSGELHDEVIPKESDENRSATAADVEPVATPEKTPTVMESISGLQHSGELHDQVIPKESDENKGATAAEVEPVGASEKTPTALESISGLQHSGELHDQAIPKESDENKNAVAADIEPVATSAKTPTVLELISGLQHSGELHDQLIPKQSSKDETKGSVLETKKSTVALQAMSGLQHSGELHDQLIPKDNEENTVASDLKTRRSQEAPSLGLQCSGELHDELIAKAISEKEVQKSPVLGLQHSGELHDNLISKSINGVDTGKSPDLKHVRKIHSDEIQTVSHENIEDKKELEQSLEGSSGSVIIPSENVKEQSKVKDVETSKQEIDETAAKLTVDETIAQAASKIQAGVRGYLTRKLYNKTPSKDASTNNRIDSGNKLSDKEVQDALTQLDILPVPSESPHMSRHKREVADIDLGDIRMEDSSGQKDKLSRSKTVHGVETEKSLIPNLFKSLSVTDSALSKTLDDDEDKLHDSTEESVSLEHTEDLGIGSEKSAMLHSDTIIKNIDGQQTPKESSTASLEHSGELHDIVTPKESEKSEGTNYSEVKKEEEQFKVLGNGKPAEELKSTSKESVSAITDEVSAAKSHHLLSSERQHSGELHDSSISQDGPHDSDKSIMLKTDVLQHVIPKELQQESQNKESVDKLDNKDSLEIGKVEQKLETEALQHSGELHDILLPKEASKGIQNKNKLLKDNLQHSGEMHDLLIPNHGEEGQEDKIEIVEDNGQHTVDELSTEIQCLSKEIQHGKDNLQHSGELHDLLQPSEVKAPAYEAKDIEDVTVAGIEDNDKVSDKESQELQDGKIVVKDIPQHSGELHDVLIAKDAEKISQKSNNAEKDEDNFQHTAAQNDFLVPAETKDISEKAQEDKTLPNEIEKSLQEVQDTDNLREKGTQVSDKPSDKIPQELQDGKALKQEILEHSGELHDILIPKHIEANFQKLHDNNSNAENLQHSGELHDILVSKTVEGISQELENDIQSKKKDIQHKAQEDLMRDLRHTAVDGLAGATDDIKSTVSSADDQQEDNQQSKQNDIQEKVKDDLIADLHHTKVEDGLEGGTTDDSKSTEPSPDDQQKDLNKKLNNLKSNEADDIIKQATSHDIQSGKVDSQEFAKQESGLASINGLQHSGELHDLLLPQNDIFKNPEIEKEKVNTEEEIHLSPTRTTSSASINDLQKMTSADAIQHSGEMHDILIPQEKLTKTDTHNESFVDSPETAVGYHQAPKENYEKEQTTAGQLNAIEARSGDHFTSLVLDEQASVNTTATSFEKDSNHQKAVGLQHAGELNDTLITEQTKNDFPDEETKDDSKPLAPNQVQNVEVAKVECSGSENSLNQPYTPSVLAEPPELEDKEGFTSATPSFHSQHNTLLASSETYTTSPTLKDAQKKIDSADTSLATITEPLHNELKTNTEQVEPLTKHTQELVSVKMPNTDKQLSDASAEDENLLVSHPNSQNEETSQIKKAKPLSAGTKPEKYNQELFSQDNNVDMKTVGKQIDEFTKEDLGNNIAKDNKIDKKSVNELPQTKEDISRNKQDSVKNDSMKDIEDQILKNDEIDSISGGSVLQEPFEHFTPRHDLGIAKETDAKKTSSDISKFRTELEKVGKEAESIDHAVLDISSPKLEQCIEEEKGGRSNTPSDISKVHSELKGMQKVTEKDKIKEIGESSGDKNVVGDEKFKEITAPESKEGKLDQKDQKLNVLEESAKSAEANGEDYHEEDRNNSEGKPRDGKNSKISYDISKLRAELEETAKEIEEIDHEGLKVRRSSSKLKDNIKEVESARSNTAFDISKLHSELEGPPKETEKDEAEENGRTPDGKKAVGDEKFKEITVPESGKGKVDQKDKKLNVLEENAKSAETNEENYHEEDRKNNEDKPEDGKHSETSSVISKLRAELEEAEKEIEEIDHAALEVSGSSPKLEDNIEEVESARSITAFDISKLHSELEESQKKTKKDVTEENGRSPGGKKVVGDEKLQEITVPESEEVKVDQKDQKLNVLEKSAKSAETNEEDHHEEDLKNNEDKLEDGKHSKSSFDISKLRAELEEAEKGIEEIDHAVLKVSGSSPKLEDNIEGVECARSNTAFNISKLHSDLEGPQKETEKDETEENGRSPGGKKVVGDEKLQEITVPESEEGKVDQKDQKLNVLEESAKSAETNEEDYHEEDRKSNEVKPKDGKHSKTSFDISKLRAELEEAEKEIEEIDHAVLETQGSSPKLEDNIEEVKNARSNTAFDISKLHSELEGPPKETDKYEAGENGRTPGGKKVVGNEKFKEIPVPESGKGKVDQKDQKINVLEESAKEINEEDHQEEYLKNNEVKPEDDKHSKTSFDISKLRSELEEAEKEIGETDHAVLKVSGSSPKLEDNIEEVKGGRSNTPFDISKHHSELEGTRKGTKIVKPDKNGKSYAGEKVVGDEKFKETTVSKSEEGKADQKDQILNVLEERAKSAETNEEEYHEEDRNNNEDKPKEAKNSKPSFDISKLHAELEKAEKEVEDIDHAVLKANGSNPKLKENIEEVKSARSNIAFDISKLCSELEGTRKDTEKDKPEEIGRSYDGEKVAGGETFKQTTVPKSEAGKADQKDQKSELEKAERETESIDRSVLKADGSSPKVEENIEEVKTGRSNTAFDISKLHSELEGTRKETEKDKLEENGSSYDGEKVVDGMFKQTTVPKNEEGKADQNDQKLNVLEESAKSAKTNEQDYHEGDRKTNEDKPEDGKNSKTSFDISKLRAELEKAEKETENIDHAGLEAQRSSPKLEQNIEEKKSGHSNNSSDLSKLHSELEGTRKETENKLQENERSYASEKVVGNEKFKEPTVPESVEGKDQKDQKSELEKAERETESIDHAVLKADGSSPEVDKNIQDVKSGRSSIPFDISKLHSELEKTQNESQKDKTGESGGSYDSKKIVGDDELRETTVPKSKEGKAQIEPKKDEMVEVGGSYHNTEIQSDERFTDTTVPENILREESENEEPNADRKDQNINVSEEKFPDKDTMFSISKLRAQVEQVANETDRDKNELVVDGPATLDESEKNVEEDALKNNDQGGIVIEETSSKYAAGEKTFSDTSRLRTELEVVEGEKKYNVGDLNAVNHHDGVQETVAEKQVQALLTKGENEIEAAKIQIKKNQRVGDEKKEAKTKFLAGTKENAELDEPKKQQEDGVLGSNGSTEMSTISKTEVSDKAEEGAFSEVDRQDKQDGGQTLKTASKKDTYEEKSIETKTSDGSGKNSVKTSKPFDISELRNELEAVDAVKEDEPDKSVLPNISVKICQDDMSQPKTVDISKLHSELNDVKNKMKDRNETPVDTVLASKEFDIDSKEKKKEEVLLNKSAEEKPKVEPTDASESKAFLGKYKTQESKKNYVDQDSDDTKSSSKGRDYVEKIQSVDISDSKIHISDDENKQDSKENAETKDIAADRPKSEVVINNNETIQVSKEDNEKQYNEKQIPINVDAIESAKLKLADHSELKTKSIDNRDEKEAEHTEKHILFSADSVDHPKSTFHITNVKNKQESEADNEIQKSINEGISATLKDNPALEVPLMHNQNDQEAKDNKDKKEKISVYAGESDSSDHLQSKILFPSSKNIDLTKQDNGEQPLSNSHEEELQKQKTEDHPESETLIKNKENSQVSKEENKRDAQIMPTEEKSDSQENQVISTPITNLKATPLLNNIPTPVQSADRNPQNSLPDESLANIYKSAPTRPVTSDIAPDISPSKNIQIPSENLHKQIQDIEQIIKPDIESDENFVLASKNVNKDANVEKIGETKHVSEAENSIKGNYENDEQNRMAIIPSDKIQNLEESSYNEETKSVNSDRIIRDDNKTRTEEDLERPISITSTTSADSVATVIALSPRELSAERKESLVRSNSSEISEENKTDTQIENNVSNEGILTKHVSQEENKDTDRHEKHEHGKTESNAKEAATDILDMTKLKSEIEEQKPEMLKYKPIESFFTKSDQENENLPTSLKVNNANNENSKTTSNKENSVKEIKDGQVSSNETLTHDTSSFETEKTFGNGRSKNDIVDNHNGQQLRESPDLGKHAAATTIQSNYRGYRVRRDLGNHNLNSLQIGAEIFDKKEEKQSRENSPDINEHIKETLLQHTDNEDTDEILPEVSSTAEKDSLSKNSDKHSKASNQPLIINALGTEDKANRNIKDISREESVTHISPVFADVSSNFQKPEEMGEERNGNDPKMVNQVPETNVAVSTTDEDFSANEQDSKISNKRSENSKLEIDEDTTIAETTSGKLPDARVSSEDLEDLQKSELNEDVKTEDSSSSKTIDGAAATPLLKKPAKQATNSKAFANKELKGKNAVSAESPLSELDKKPEEINKESFCIENKNIDIVQHHIATAPPLHLLEHEYDNVSTNQMANSFNNDVSSNSATAPPLTLLKDVNNQHTGTKATDHLLQSSSTNSEESSSSREVIKSVDPIEHLLIPKKLKEGNQLSALDINSQDNLFKLPYPNKKNEIVSAPTNLEGEQSSEKMGSKNNDSKFVDMLVSPRFHGDPAAAVPKALDVVLDQQLAIATPNAGERQESIDSEGPEYIHIPLKGSIELPSKEASNSGLQYSGKLHDTIDTPSLNLKQEESCKELRLENKSEECKTEIHGELAAVDDFSSSKYDLVKGDVSPRTQEEEERAVPKALGVVLDQQLAIATPKGEQKQDTSKSETAQYIHIPLKGSVGNSSSAEKINSADASTSGLQHAGEIHDMIAIPPLDLNPEDEAHKRYNLVVNPEPKEVSNIQNAPTSASATDDFTSSKYDWIESGVSPRVRKEVKGAIPKALGAILDQQLAITTPHGEEGKEGGKSKEPEYIYIPLKDPEDIPNGLQHSGEFHDTIPIPLPESKQVTKEDPVEKSADSAQKQKIEASTENVLGDASNEWDSSKYDLVKGETIPRIRKEQEGAVPKVLGTVLDQQLAITAPLGKSKEVENEFVHPKYVHIPLKDTNELLTSKEDNLNNSFQSGADSFFRERSLTNGPDKENSNDSAQGKELTIRVHDQDINKSSSCQEDNKPVTFQGKELAEEHQSQHIDKKEPTHLVSGVNLCKSLLPQERNNITTSVFNAEQLTNGQYPTTKLLLKEDLHNGIRGGHEVDKKVDIPLKSQSQKLEEPESKPSNLNLQLQKTAKSSLGDSPTEHATSSPVNSSLDLPISPTSVVKHKAEDLNKSKVEEPPLERTLAAKLSSTNVNHKEKTATLDLASKRESLPIVSPISSQPSSNRLTDNTVLLLPTERDQQNSPSFDLPPQHLQNGTPTFGLQLRFSPSPTRNMERRSNSETGNVTPTIDGNENLNSAREDRSVQSDSPPIVIQSTQISDNTMPLAVQLNQPPGAPVLTSPTPNDDDDDDEAGDCPAAHASEKGASTKVEARKNRAHFRTSMETDKRKNATIKEKNMEEVAATKIQAGFRGYQVRKQLKLKNGGVDSVRRSLRRKSSGKLRGSEKVSQKSSSKPSDLEEKSATKIQAGIRGFLVRRRQQKKAKNSTTPESS